MEIINAGIPGNGSADILARLDSIIEAAPDLVCLMVGTNDVLNSRKNISLREYEENVLKIIRRLKESSCAVVLMSIPPCIDQYLIDRHGSEYFKDYSPSEKVNIANKILRGIAIAEGLPQADIYKAIELDKANFLRQVSNCGEPDGVHLMPDGYKVMAAEVFSAVKSLNTNFQKIVCLGDSITYGVYVPGAGTASGECYPGQLFNLF